MNSSQTSNLPGRFNAAPRINGSQTQPHSQLPGQGPARAGSIPGFVPPAPGHSSSINHRLQPSSSAHPFITSADAILRFRCSTSLRTCEILLRTLCRQRDRITGNAVADINTHLLNELIKAKLGIQNPAFTFAVKGIGYDNYRADDRAPLLWLIQLAFNNGFINPTFNVASDADSALQAPAAKINPKARIPARIAIASSSSTKNRSPEIESPRSSRPPTSQGTQPPKKEGVGLEDLLETMRNKFQESYDTEDGTFNWVWITNHKDEVKKLLASILTSKAKEEGEPSALIHMGILARHPLTMCISTGRRLDNEQLERLFIEQWEILMQEANNGDIDTVAATLAVHEGDADTVIREFCDTYKVSEHISQFDWNATCDFFGHDKNSSAPFRLPFMGRAIEPHQAMAVYFNIRHAVLTAGSFICDEQGLGKTLEALVTAAMMAWIEYAWNDLDENPGEHLSSNDGRKTCPRAKKLQLPFTCPCQPGFPDSVRETFRRRKRPFQGPALFIVQAGTISPWIQEFQQCFPRDKQVDNPVKLRLSVGHETGGELRLNEDVISQLVRPRPGQTAEFILTTPQSYQSHVEQPIQKFIRENSSQNSKGKAKQMPGRTLNPVKWGATFLDECHTLRSSTSQTLSRLLEKKLENNNYMHGSFFPMSGTLWEKGPRDIFAYIEWFNLRWRYDEMKGLYVPEEGLKIRKVCTLQAIQQIGRDMQKCQKVLTKGGDPRDQDKARDDLREVGRRLANTLKDVMLRRTSGTLLFNQEPILKLTNLDKIKLHAEPPNSLKAMFKNMTTNVRNDIVYNHRRTVNTWKQHGRRDGEEPTVSIETAIRRIECVRPYASFPHLHTLRGSKQLSGLTIDALVERSVLAKPGDNILSENARQLINTSFRFKKIWSKLKNDIRKRERSADKREQRQQKILILSHFPIVAACYYECLMYAIAEEKIRNAAGEMVKVDLYHSGDSATKRAKKIQGFQEVRKKDKRDREVFMNGTPVYEEDFRPEIICGTIGVLGLGVTLHAASQAYITEPQFSHSRESQASKRIHRIGQRYDCTVYTVHSDEIEFEAIAANNVQFRSFLKDVTHEVDTGAPTIVIDDD